MLDGLLQVLGDCGELFQGGFEVGGDFAGDDFRGGEVGGFFEGVVFEPEDVQIDFVPLRQFFVREGLESLGLFAFVTVFGVVARDEVIKVAAFERVFLEREVHVGSQVVDPELLRPGRFLSRFAVEEQYVGLDSLSIKDPGRQSQQSMHVGLFQQFAADSFACSAFKQHVVGQNHGGSSVLFQNRENVLQEVELFVARRRPEVIAVNGERFFGRLPGFVDDRDAALLAERRIGEHNFVFAMLADECIFRDDRQIFFGFAVSAVRLGPDAVQKQIHRTQASHAVDQFDAEERAAFEFLLLGSVKLEVFDQVNECREQKAACAASRIADGLPRLRCDDINHRCNQRTRRKVLSRPAFDVFGVLLQQAFVSIAFDVRREA